MKKKIFIITEILFSAIIFWLSFYLGGLLEITNFEHWYDLPFVGTAVILFVVPLNHAVWTIYFWGER